MNINIAESKEDILRCFPVMRQLRTQLTEDEFVNRVQHQSKSGYIIAFVEDAGMVKAVTGFRIKECLCDGKFLYVDDFVTDEAQRTRGFGSVLFDWIVEYAIGKGCNEIDLDSGVQRFEAHRFYLKKHMKISSHHFSLDLRNHKVS